MMPASQNRSFDRKLLPLQHAIAVLLLILCLGSIGTRANAMEYTVHVGPSGWLPFVMVERIGDDISHYGVMFDFLDQFEAAYPKYTRNNLLSTRKRVNAMMEKGEKIDLMLSSPGFVSSKVLENYKFTETLARTTDKVISRKSQNFQYNTPHDLIGKKVGTIRGYSYGHFDFLMNFDYFNDVRVDTHPQAIGMLIKNRIDVYIGNSLASPFYIAKSGLDLSEFVFPEASLYEFNIAFAVNKRRPELYENLNKFIVEFVADGKFEALLERYLAEYQLNNEITD